MTLTLGLPEPTVRVAAGRTVAVPLEVCNDDNAPRRVSLAVGGRAAAWFRLGDADAGDLLVGGGQTVTATLLVSPPVSAGPPGQPVAFSLRATVDGVRTASASGLVLLEQVPLVRAVADPVSAASRGTAHFRVVLATTSPTGLLVTLQPAAPATVRVGVDPVALRVDPAADAVAEVTVRCRRPALRGPRRHTARITWETDGPAGVVRGNVPVVLVQQPLLAPSVSLLLAAVLAVALTLAGRQLAVRLGTTGFEQPAGTAASGGPRVGGVGPGPGATGPVRPEPAPRRPYALLSSALDEPGYREQARQLVDALRGAGVPVRLAVVDGPAPSAGTLLLVVRDDLPGPQAVQRFCREVVAAGRPCSAVD